MERTFVAIDVETANPDRASICQVGLVRVEDGAIGDSWTTLIDPETYFDPWNIEVHGITPSMVGGQPRFSDLAARVREFVGASVVVSHTGFDRVAMERAHERANLVPPGWSWLDTARVSRRAWKQLAGEGYGLANVAAHCGVQFRHHDAGEDARAAAIILLRAMEESGLDLPAWLSRVRRPIEPQGASIAQEGNPDGPLAGEVVVFTGALLIPRAEGATQASRLGCDVRTSVSGKTTMLVVGQQDLERLGGYTKSSKQRKAEELVRHGAAIAILSEADFMRLIENGKSPGDCRPVAHEGRERCE
jgi:DNA polymerase-3 subunit epsilon